MNSTGKERDDMAAGAIELFYSYARAAECLRDQLHKYLRPLRDEGLVRIDEKRITLASAQIILLLVSPDFVSSDYCMDVEVPKALCIPWEEPHFRLFTTHLSRISPRR